MKIMVTGGAGYIGSHTCVELMQDGHEIIIVDNLINSKEKVLERIAQITGKTARFYCVDLLDQNALEQVFAEQTIDAVIHFAALKAVGESVSKPLRYYHNNVTGTMNLCAAMQKYNVKNIVFSSSATVYGDPSRVPITEDSPIQPTNPYGHSKAMIEQILLDFQQANPEWNVVILRYFNPIGAHISGLIGEDPNGIPNNLVPYIAQVAVGKLARLRVFGNDYPTPDGTGIRDYVHVVDLAQGHVKALDRLASHPGAVIYNLGTGQGHSVMEMLAAFEKACHRSLPYEIVARRPGDIATCYADPSLAERELGWKAIRGIEEMCADSWRWQSQNPEGF